MVVTLRPCGRGQSQWNPNIGVVGKLESPRHHSDDLKFRSLEKNLAAEHGPVARIALLPKPVTDQCGQSASGTVLVGGDVAAECWSHAQHRQQIVRDRSDLHLL